MAAISTPAPGSAYGPCTDPCEHIDCAASREDAERLCALCGEPIGFETYWWRVDESPQHRACTMEAAEV